jgi:hypothetical protein
MLPSFLPSNPKSLRHCKIKRKGGSIDLGNGVVKHRRVANSKGVEGYLGGQRNIEAWRSGETPRNNKTKDEY